MRKLPPLNAIRAFECAGRHRSFAVASEELHVTPSAISHQVKALETFLGVPLFDRLTRRIELTVAGAQYLASASEAMDVLDEATRRLRAATDERVLTLAVAPTFAGMWLVPHLLDFQEHHPEVEVRLASTLATPDFRRSDVDIAILMGPGEWDGLYVERLTREDLVVMCTPALAARLTTHGDLREVPIVRVLSRPGQWRSWLQANGLDDVDVRARSIVVDTTSLGLEAAASGLGVMLADHDMAAPYLDAGDLVVPFREDLETGRGYHIVCPHPHVDRPSASRFLAWLRSQIPAPAATV